MIAIIRATSTNEWRGIGNVVTHKDSIKEAREYLAEETEYDGVGGWPALVGEGEEYLLVPIRQTGARRAGHGTVRVRVGEKPIPRVSVTTLETL